MNCDHCLQSHGPWTPDELAWAIERGFIGIDAVTDYLRARSEPENVTDFDALDLQREILPSGDRWVRKSLSGNVGGRREEEIERRWLLALLDDVYARRAEVADPLAEVETIYADFDYPESMERFVRYMPPSDGYDPSKHTHEENLTRLMANWARFLGSSTPKRAD